MKSHPELFAWLFLLSGFIALFAIAFIIYYWRTIRSIWRDDGPRWGNPPS